MMGEALEEVAAEVEKNYHRPVVVCTILCCLEGKTQKSANVRSLAGGGGML